MNNDLGCIFGECRDPEHCAMGGRCEDAVAPTKTTYQFHGGNLVCNCVYTTTSSGELLRLVHICENCRRGPFLDKVIRHASDCRCDSCRGRRPTEVETLLDHAEVAASRSTCSRLHVGAVIAHGPNLISVGRNGAPMGAPHCYHPPGDDTPCTVSVHAERNAITFAARRGTGPTEGATMYLTHSPCSDCAGMIINAGIVRVVYRREYRSTAGQELLVERGIEVVQQC